MNLRRIFLRCVAGIDPPFDVAKLSPAINVIVGPNGSGKTSLRKAVAATLWPKRDASRRLEIESDWQDGERRLRAVREGGHVSWSANGSPIDPPAVPDVHLAPCYTLGVGDLLLSDSTTDRVIANDIRVAMSGGYDVRGVMKECFTPSTQLGRRAAKELGDAKAQYHSVQADQRQLANAEDRLATLREQERAAKTAGETIARIDDALALYDARSKLSTVQARISQFPSAMAKLSAHDGERLDQRDKDFANAAADIAQSDRQISDAKRTIHECGFGDTAPSQEALDTAAAHVQRLEKVEATLAEVERDRSAATVTLEAARQRLAGTLDVEAAPPPATLPALEQVEQFIRKRDQSRAKRDAFAERTQMLVGEVARDDVGVLADAANLLREWLAAPSAAHATAPTWLIVTAIGLAAIGIALAGLHHLAWLLLAGAGVGGAIALLATVSATHPGGVERAQYEERLRELKIDAPTAWTPEHVRALLRDLDRRLVAAHRGEMATMERALLSEKLRNAEEELVTLSKEAIRLRATIGIDTCGDLVLHDIAISCREYADARARMLALDGEAAGCRREQDELRKQVGAVLRAHNAVAVDLAEDAAALGAQLKALQRRLDAYCTARDKMRAATEALGGAQSKLSDAEAKIRQFYEDRGLTQGERARLDVLLGQLPDYEALTVERSRHTVRIAELEPKLRQHLDLLDVDEASLIARREVERMKSETLTDISQEIGGIQNRLETARTGTLVAEALAKVATTRDALVDTLEQTQLAAAGRFLLEQVDEEHEKQSRPVVLERAMQHFAAFTHNAYELTLADGDDAGFRARDTSRDRFVELSELSDGTRIQLLLAVRLAFATSAERDARIPLMLDEALSTSDPDRFRAVVEALVILAGEGRQIFYLTSNPADVMYWRAVAQGDTALDVEIVDLGRIRGQQAAVESAAELVLPAPRAIPKPDGMTAEQYGVALGVPPAAAHGPIASLHLFYVLRHDLPLLHRLVGEFRIDTLGRWESFSRSGRASVLLPADACRRLDALCTCARAAHDAAAIGRGKPIDDQAFADSGAVSDTFMPAVRAVNHDIGRDAQRLLDVIANSADERLKGFRKKALEKLGDHLREHGYLDERPRLARAEIYARSLEPVRTALADHVLEQKDCLGLVDDLLAAFRYAE